jgi:hypothetical protein
LVTPHCGNKAELLVAIELSNRCISYCPNCKPAFAGNWDMGDYGLLLYPLLDFPGNLNDAQTPLFLKNEQDRDALKVLASYYPPVSFLHASFARSLVIDHTMDTALALLVGTKYKQNWSMKRYHENGWIEVSKLLPIWCWKTPDRCLGDSTPPLSIQRKRQMLCEWNLPSRFALVLWSLQLVRINVRRARCSIFRSNQDEIR